MNAIIFFACCLLALNGYAQASTCEIEGWKDENYSIFTFRVPINDTFRGVVATFTTKNILRMKMQNVNYLNATWENQKLTFFTSDKYKNYEKEADYTSNPVISLVINAVCTEDGTKKMTFKLPIVDNNNHSPIIGRKSYDYVFGMSVPKDLALTNIIPITAVEYDITNKGVFFSLDDNENFKIERIGKQTSNHKEFKTTLTAKRIITAPFKQTLTLTVKDDGHPVRSATVPLTITVATPEELKTIRSENSNQVQVRQETTVHPPVFEKHMYFADYTSNHDFKMEESIVIKYGAQQNTQLKQKGYEQYFKVQFEDATHEKITVHKIASLPNEVIQTTTIITIEIEAVNEGLNLPGRTALLIRLPNVERNSNLHSQKCDVSVSSGYSTFPLVLFLLAVFCIVFINIFVALMFVNKSKMHFRNV